MNVTATNKKLRDLLLGIRDQTLIPRPEFQRRLVWTNRDKSKFLDTVLSGLPFPEIYIASREIDVDSGVGTELLVDGQQRITTLYQYFNGSDELKLNKDIRPYSQLSTEEKTRFLEYDVVVRYIGPKSVSEIRDIFERINATSYSLNAMEIHNSRYAGEFKNFGEFIAQNAFFDRNRIFSANEIRRMGDVRFALSFIITMMSTYFNRDDELDSFLATYNDTFEQRSELEKEIDETIALLDKCGMGPNRQIAKQSNLFTVLVELHRAMFKENLRLEADEVDERLDSFFRELASRDQLNETQVPRIDLEDYFKAGLQATNDRSSRIRRGQIVAQVIRGTYLESGPTPIGAQTQDV